MTRRRTARLLPPSLAALALAAATATATAATMFAAQPAEASSSTSSVCSGSTTEARSLSSAIAHAYSAVGDDHGIAVYDLSTGVSCADGANQRMITASIVKASILATLLLDQQRKGTGLSSSERSLATGMIEESDNDDASALFDDIGGASGLDAFFRTAGMTESSASSAWGLTETTANDQVKLLKLLAAPNSVLDSASRSYELGLMRHVESDQRWGTPYDAAKGLTVAVKNGWLSQPEGAWHINSLGVFTGGSHVYVMAVTTQDNGSEGSGIDDVETLAKAVNTHILATTLQPRPSATPTAATSASASPSPAQDAAQAQTSPRPLSGGAALPTGADLSADSTTAASASGIHAASAASTQHSMTDDALAFLLLFAVLLFGGQWFVRQRKMAALGGSALIRWNAVKREHNKRPGGGGLDESPEHVAGNPAETTDAPPQED